MNRKNYFPWKPCTAVFSIVDPMDLDFHVFYPLSTRFGARRVYNVGDLNSKNVDTSFTTMVNLGMFNMHRVKANCNGILLKIVDTFSPRLLIISLSYPFLVNTSCARPLLPLFACQYVLNHGVGIFHTLVIKWARQLSFIWGHHEFRLDVSRSENFPQG